MNLEDKKIEQLVENLMEHQSLESPSKDFVSNIMLVVDRPVNTEVFVYKPLISKTAWFVILGIIVSLFTVVYFNDTTVETSWLSKIDFQNLRLGVFNNFSVNWSTSFIYAFVILSIMVGFQVSILKNFINKEFKY